MPPDYHTQMGFQALQIRLWNAVTALAHQKGLRLGQEQVWMDGKGSLPTQGGSVALTIRLSSGEQEKVTLDGAQVAAYLDGRLSHVERTLGQTLDTLKVRRPR
ncbi:MAG TPA: hypothetical protein VK466_08520 [Terriglobales bacterium]|nr:hypothetical protein [Terriglobales bacterium]